MYTKLVPFKDFSGKPQNKKVQFNLETREVMKLMVELTSIFTWRDSLMEEETRDLSTEELVAFFNNFEEILLTAYGELSEDNLYFVKTDRYKFEDSKLFAACMEMFVSDVPEINRLLKEIMPDGMETLVKRQQESLNAPTADPQTQAEIQAKIAQLTGQLNATPPETPAAE